MATSRPDRRSLRSRTDQDRARQLRTRSFRQPIVDVVTRSGRQCAGRSRTIPPSCHRDPAHEQALPNVLWHVAALVLLLGAWTPMGSGLGRGLFGPPVILASSRSSGDGLPDRRPNRDREAGHAGHGLPVPRHSTERDPRSVRDRWHGTRMAPVRRHGCCHLLRTILAWSSAVLVPGGPNRRESCSCRSLMVRRWRVTMTELGASAAPLTLALAVFGWSAPTHDNRLDVAASGGSLIRTGSPRHRVYLLHLFQAGVDLWPRRSRG
jgi:hypothetical protein